MLNLDFLITIPKQIHESLQASLLENKQLIQSSLFIKNSGINSKIIESISRVVQIKYQFHPGLKTYRRTLLIRRSTTSKVRQINCFLTFIEGRQS